MNNNNNNNSANSSAVAPLPHTTTLQQHNAIHEKLKFANNASVSIRNLEPFAQQCLHLFDGQFTVMQNRDLYLDDDSTVTGAVIGENNNNNTPTTTSENQNEENNNNNNGKANNRVIRSLTQFGRQQQQQNGNNNNSPSSSSSNSSSSSSHRNSSSHNNTPIFNNLQNENNANEDVDGSGGVHDDDEYGVSIVSTMTTNHSINGGGIGQLNHQKCSSSSEFMFPRFKSVKPPLSSVEHKNHPSTFSTQQHLLLKCIALRIQSKFTEPLFCSLELVDVKHRKRVSERIWFHRNSFGMVNDFYEDLDMKRKVKDHGISGGNGIFSLTSQHARPHDIFVVMWVWRTLNAQSRDQIYGKASLLGKKNGTILAGNSMGGVFGSANGGGGGGSHHGSGSAVSTGDHESEAIEMPTMPSDNVGLKSYMTPFCVGFAPLAHRGNMPSMATSNSGRGRSGSRGGGGGGSSRNSSGSSSMEKQDSKHPYGHDGFLIAMTHFFPPCTYHDLFANLIPNVQGQCSVTVTALPSHVTQLDVLLANHMDNQTKNIAKKFKGIPGWFLLQVQSFDAHIYENDLMYRAYMLYLDANLSQRLSYGGSVQLQDAIFEIQQFNDNKLPMLHQQSKELEEQEKEALRRLQERESRRKSIIGDASRLAQTSTLSLIGGILNSSNQHLRKEPKSYLPLIVQEILPSGIAPSSPFFNFVHNLYIYPFSVDMTKLRLDDKPKMKPRHILLEITTRDANGVTLPRIYPPHYSQPNSSLQLQTSYFCSVTYDDKKPVFIDEVKIALPLPIKCDEQKVVFNFYHLVIEKGLKRRKSLNMAGEVPKVLLATCEFSLYDIVSRQDQSQNIFLPLQRPVPSAKSSTYDPKVNIFKFTTQLESTIYPRERSLASFFKDCSPFLNVIDRELTPHVNMKFISESLKKAMAAIRTMMKLPFNRIVSHYTLIIDMLVSMMSRAPDVLKNFVEDVEMPANARSSASGNGMSSPPTPTEPTSDGQRGKVRNSIVARSRGSIRAEAFSSSPTLQNVLDKNEKSKVRNSFIQRSSFRSKTDSVELPVNAAKPGDSDFDLKAYLAAQAQASTQQDSSVGNKRQSRLFSVISGNDDKKKRFSLFGANNMKKFGDDSPDQFHGLDVLVEQMENRLSTTDSNRRSNDISDFLSVSTSLFELQTLAFQGLVSIVKSACYAEDVSGRGNRLLSSYVQYIFKDVIMTTSPFCFILCEVWTNVLSLSDPALTVSACLDDGVDMKEQQSDSQNILRVIKRKSSVHGDAIERKAAQQTVDANSRLSYASYKNSMGLLATECPLFFESLQVCWFWFEMILKSFLITVQSEMKMEDSFYGTIQHTNYSHQAEKLFGLLRDLFKTLAEKVVQYRDENVAVAQTINTQIGFMIRGLISSGMFPIKYALLLMDAYVYSLDEHSNKKGGAGVGTIKRKLFDHSVIEPSAAVSTLRLKIALFRVMSDHTYFLSLNNHIYHPKEFIKETWSCPPVKLLAVCTHVVIDSHFADVEIQTLLCEAIQYVFSRYEQTSTLPKEQRPLEQQLIGRVFFPYVYVLCNKHDKLLAHVKQPYLRQHLKFGLFILSKLNRRDMLALVLGHTKDQNSGITRHQFISFLTLVLSAFAPASSNSDGGDKTQSSSGNADLEAVRMIDLSYDLFIHLVNDSEAWLHDCYAYGPPSVTKFHQFGLDPSENEPFLAYVIFYIAKLFQRMSEFVELRKILIDKLHSLQLMIGKLVKSRLVSSNCYWQWLYACAISNYQFVVRDHLSDEDENKNHLDVKFNRFLDRVTSILHEVYPDITSIDQLPPIVEDFYDPLVNSTSTAPQSSQRSMSVTEDDTSSSSVSVQANGSVLQSPDFSPSCSLQDVAFDESTTSSTPNTTAATDSTTPNVVLEYDDQEYIKCGTLEQLVWRLVNQKPNSSGKEEDRKYNEIFFFTYRSFATPAQVLNYIIAEFRHVSLDPTRWHDFTVIRLMNSIRHWMSQHPYDFTPSLYASMFIFLKRDVVEFASNIVSLPVTPNMGSNPKTVVTYLTLAKRLRDSVVSLLLADNDSEENYSVSSVEYFFSQKTPPSILPSSYVVKSDNEVVESNLKIPITEWSPIEIARQMTLIEYEIFSRIKPRECFKLGWSKPDRHTRSPHIVKLVEQLNKVSAWIATMIIREDTPKKRGALIKHWIMVAKECRSLNNFDGIFTVMGALNNSSIRRLKKSWETISQKKMKILAELEDLVSVSGNSKAMRNAILVSEPPCVPYIGLFLTDLTFIEEGNNDMTKNNLINYSKRRKIAKVIANVRLLQQKPYQIYVVPELRQKFLVCDDILDEGAMYKQSLIVEPRES